LSEPGPTPVAATESGLVAGVPALLPSVTVFKGIPYAAAPAGDLRWRLRADLPAELGADRAADG
jgi:para-nitrobenzyl esterase